MKQKNYNSDSVRNISKILRLMEVNEANIIPPQLTFVAIWISRDRKRSRSWLWNIYSQISP